MKKALKDYPIGGFVTDLIIALLVFFETNVNLWISEHLERLFWFVGVFQLLTIYTIFVGRNVSKSGETNSIIVDKLIGLYGLMLVLAMGGFLWFGLPATMLDTDEAWNAFRLNFFVVIFGGFIALIFSFRPENYKLHFIEKFLAFLAPLVYLTISETFISIAAHHQKVGIFLALVCVMLSYFPVRFLLILRPPASGWEVLTASLSFGYFVVSLFL